MRIEKVVLRLVEMPLKFRFRTSFGEMTAKRFLLVETISDGISGWGECVAEDGPFFSPETTDSARSALVKFLAPLVLGRDVAGAGEFDALAGRVRGNRMAKGALETALRDLFARAEGVSLSRSLGGTRKSVEVGVSLGLQPTVAETVAIVAKHAAQGYRRIKLKIEPGADVDRVAAVREAFPALPLTVDANAAYTLETSGPLLALDAFGLDYIEQPLHHEDLVDHAELAKRLSTPICLDESIRSAADAAAAISLGACRVLNVKIGRVGGHGEALRIHEVALAAGVPIWCGGMLESGVGRAHNIAAASLAGFTKPGDTSSSSRYFEEDIVEPRPEATDGLMPVPEGPGIGVGVRRGVLARFTLETLELSA
ncbi:MAG TPA: o-succinylbenzoate synthase [Thermoanaerobaculia bacterium]|nr:o-succinylbenzoate synthase [Thermoanaerobaculia bacterium]